jgi:hypothetical protein
VIPAFRSVKNQALAITHHEFDGLVDSEPVMLISIPPSRRLDGATRQPRGLVLAMVGPDS